MGVRVPLLRRFTRTVGARVVLLPATYELEGDVATRSTFSTSRAARSLQ